jgi:hypothetical protein
MLTQTTFDEIFNTLFTDPEGFEKKVKFDQLCFEGRNKTERIWKEKQIFIFEAQEFVISILSNRKNLSIRVNCEAVKFLSINSFLKSFQLYLSTIDIDRVSLDSIELNHDFITRVNKSLVCKDIESLETFFHCQTFGFSTFLNLHFYQPITVFRDLNIKGKKLKSCVNANIQFRRYKGSHEALYDFKIYAKGIERRARSDYGTNVDLIRLEIKIKPHYLFSSKEIPYPPILLKEEVILSEFNELEIDMRNLYYRVAYRFIVMAKKIRIYHDSDFARHPFLKELVREIDTVIPLSLKQRRFFSLILENQIKEDWLL